MSTTPPKERLRRVLVTDCGSTTTKAIAFEKRDDGWHTAYRGEAPTTVEQPVSDVTIGAVNAFREVQEISGTTLLRDVGDSDACPLIVREQPSDPNGIDLYLSTSSAGGGLQMIVLGVVGAMSTESAERAALGAGAIVMDAIACDDGREQYEHVQRIRHLRPDISLIAGGTEGGTVEHPLQLAETLLQAEPRPRFGTTLTLPVIYAANSAAREEAQKLLEKRFAFQAVENLRPSLEKENLGPARDAIHEVFLSHVMSHAPGYAKLLTWTPEPIVPTPAAVGKMILEAAQSLQQSILAVDIGGATTDVFSALRGDNNEFVFNRTVSANLVMSYSVANVLVEAGIASIRRWLPFEISEAEVADRLRNKMIRPTTIPQTLEDLLLEQSVCREALRLAFIHHKRLATGLKGVKRARTIGEFFQQGKGDGALVDMLTLDLIIGSGGVLSHAPDRRSAAFMLIDAYEPEGVTELAVDSIFMLPHLGVFSEVLSDAASEIFLRDCLVRLGAVVAPRGSMKKGADVLRVEFGGDSFVVPEGALVIKPMPQDQEVEITPLSRYLDLGAGPGEKVKRTIHGGGVGLIIDTRGRPLPFSTRVEEQRMRMLRAYDAFGLPSYGGAS
ncbi:MAG: glutamate mutase L [Deltaproteobacteria bacterium]|nr:glutamate mutase L [Deltaproteobacteria bacterium]